MANRNADSSNPQQGDGGVASTQPVPAEQQPSRPGNTVFKSGPLFISSKGIGWTSWKKRWFVLTRTSLVFFRSDPNAAPQKPGEANLTLGGIDLNSSGSVVVKADKKLLTVLFPDGRDGRAFTLKAETSEDLYEWKAALENALVQAPSGAAALENTLAQASDASLLTGQSEILKDDAANAIEGSCEQSKDKQSINSLVIDKSILLALEDDDGNPSFLEKALRFVEQYGVKVEGILRQAADVDEVERRILEFEQGKNEFSPDEDAHVIADCVKHILRASPPIPALCCTSLLDAFKTTHGSRVNAMRAAISKTFPEPTRLLLQRILKMMQIVASHKSENLMSTSAVAACMAPLLLRPLMAGDYEVGNDLNMGGDGSLQLLQAAAAANHAQAIVITLMEDFRNIFLEDYSSTESYSEASGSNDEELTGDEVEDDDYDDEDDDIDIVSEDDYDEESDLDSETEDDHDEENDLKEEDDSESKLTGSSNENSSNEGSDTDYSKGPSHNHSAMPAIESRELSKDASASASPGLKSDDLSLSVSSPKFIKESNGSLSNRKRPAWGRAPGRKNLSMESIEYPIEDEIAIQKLESTKVDLQSSIEKEAKEHAVLQEGLESQKQALHKRRLALEQDVARLQEQLQKERDLRATLEAALTNPLGHLTISSTLDCKIKAEIEELALAETDIINLNRKVADLQVQLNLQRQDNHVSVCQSCTALSHEKSRDHNNDAKTRAAKHNRENSPPSEDDPPFSNKRPSPEQQKDMTSHNVSKFPEKTNSLSMNSEHFKTQDPTLSNKQSSQQKQIESASQYETKSMETVASLSTDSQNVVTQDHPASSNKQPPRKFHQDLASENSSIRKSTGGSSLSTDSKNAVRQEQVLSSQQKSQNNHSEYTSHNKAMAKTASLSTKPQDVAPQDPQSLPNNQPSSKLQPNLVSENSNKNKSSREKTSSSSNSANVVIQDPTLSNKQPFQKKQIHSTSQEKTKLMGTASMSNSEIIAKENPQSLSNKQPSKKKRPDLVRENSRKNKSKGETTGLSTRLVESKDHHDVKSMGTASLSTDSVNAVTHDPPSLSDKHNSLKLQPDLVTENSSITKSTGDTTSSSTGCENMVLSSKQLSQKKQINSTNPNKNKSMGTTSRSDSQNVSIQDPSSSLPNRQQSTNAISSSPADEPLTVSRNTSSSKKNTGKVEGSVSGPNPLTRLANRIYFLKERRTQIAHELQILRSGGNPNSAGPPKRSTLDESKSGM